MIHERPKFTRNQSRTDVINTRCEMEAIRTFVYGRRQQVVLTATRFETKDTQRRTNYCKID